MNKALWEFGGKRPHVGANVLLAAGARLVGDVEIGAQSSIWFNAVLRGDVNRIVIGHHSNIQDNATCHVDVPTPCVVGNYVTVGHGAILHGCTIRDEVLIGMGAVVMDGVVIGEQSIIGAAALLTGGLKVPARSLVYGAPAKVISKLGEKEVAKIRRWAEEYCELAAQLRRETINDQA
jgi:carbonic anhydrase/acetyltransferase-like protein (isoleucine patch superfamily)